MYTKDLRRGGKREREKRERDKTEIFEIKR